MTTEETTAAPAELAEALLREWELRTQPTRTASYALRRPQLIQQMTELSRTILGQELNLDADDLRYILRQSHTLRIGTATAAGPDRASRLIDSVFANAPVSLPDQPDAESAVIALLLITTCPEQDVDMDELVVVTEHLQSQLGSDTELLFGHQTHRELPFGVMQVWMLAGYAAPAATS